jgi:uncharacterized protein (TIGR03437 family)
VADDTGAYISAHSINAGDFLVRKYDYSGNVLWTKRLPTASFSSLALDKSGLYVGGTVAKPLPGQCAAGGYDAVVEAYGVDGTELWTRQFGSYYGESSNRVALGDGAIYVAGTQHSGKWYPLVQCAYLAKLTPESADAGSGSGIRQECVLNAASLIGGAVAPGEIVTILGVGLGPSSAVAAAAGADRRLPDVLAGARVLFNGLAAPLLSVSATQIEAIVPLALGDQTTADVQIEYNGKRSPALSLPVLSSRPGIFTQDGSGTGQAAALNQDGTVNSPSNPAARKSIISLYATGLGATDPPLADGEIVNGAAPKVKAPVQVVFTNDGYIDDGVWANVVSATGVTGMVDGLVQINVEVPDDQYLSAPGGWAPQIVLGYQWMWVATVENTAIVSLQ